MITEQSIQSPTRDRVETHVNALRPVLDVLQTEAPLIGRWGETLAERLLRGQRLLAAGNGGSAAEAQHLTAELVGRFDGERRPFSAISLHAETSAVTAIANDYGYDEVFARQVSGHARHGDILLLLSTSGASRNLLLAAEAASACGATTWALTGEGPNPLSSLVDEALCLPGPSANVQEAQLVAIHAICRVFDAAVAAAAERGRS
ncbi:SIS domain-containing protein [Leucobacter sp. CSA1]|uniref:SIS domain-containing protein n=1 Tax=Leucobacter chromiisoli TaxID=2796471 RepID=A0A934QAG1_9MICO|nr:SIS domain-containing protein [Leucobacter chromiisoli]MBK0419727.1 SIS domain-containing protein [Leucobacter chromiisoli]